MFVNSIHDVETQSGVYVFGMETDGGLRNPLGRWLSPDRFVRSLAGAGLPFLVR